MARIQSKIQVDPQTGCWLYVGCVDKDGYARMKVEGKNRQAHVVCWEEHTGRKLAPGMTLDHLKGSRGPCRHRRCVCPDHLEEVTRSENSRRVHVDKKGDL